MTRVKVSGSPVNRTAGAVISGHEKLSEGVRRVIYSNGTVVYVNYTATEKTVETAVSIHTAAVHRTAASRSRSQISALISRSDDMNR